MVCLFSSIKVRFPLLSLFLEDLLFYISLFYFLTHKTPFIFILLFVTIIDFNIVFWSFLLYSYRDLPLYSKPSQPKKYIIILVPTLVFNILHGFSLIILQNAYTLQECAGTHVQTIIAEILSMFKLHIIRSHFV